MINSASEPMKDTVRLWACGSIASTLPVPAGCTKCIFGLLITIRHIYCLTGIDVITPVYGIDDSKIALESLKDYVQAYIILMIDLTYLGFGPIPLFIYVLIHNASEVRLNLNCRTYEYAAHVERYEVIKYV
uniref:Uncharacterized protein n=1 Tax=Glossina palpalis gambiensis TaxID=67801 RepID=A0A1B0B8L8_9MUSC